MEAKIPKSLEKFELESIRQRIWRNREREEASKGRFWGGLRNRNGSGKGRNRLVWFGRNSWVFLFILNEKKKIEVFLGLYTQNFNIITEEIFIEKFEF